MRLTKLAYVLIPVLGILSGCTGKRPFLLVQMCLGDEQNTAIFVGMLKDVARSQNMAFVDGGKNTQERLVELKKSPDYPLIHIGVERNDGMGLIAGNQGLSQYEVAIGFSKGANSVEAHQFADFVVARLKQRWDVHVVPADRGALPMKGCGKSEPQ